MRLSVGMIRRMQTATEHDGEFGLAMLRHLVHNLVHCSGAGLKKPSLFKGIDA